jgi:hypothetical protein
VDEGERAELEEAYRAFGQDLWRAIYVFSGGMREIAEDAVAEAFVRAGSRVGAIRELRPWLYRVALEVSRADPPGRAEGVGDLLEMLNRPHAHAAGRLRPACGVRSVVPRCGAGTRHQRGRLSRPSSWSADAAPATPGRGGSDMKRDEFTGLRKMPEPDLWPRIERELAQVRVEPSGKGPRRRIPQRGLALATALVVVAGTAIGLWAVTRNGSSRGPGPGRAAATVKPNPESVTVVATGYPLACTFRVLSSVVQPGEPVRWQIVLDNRGNQTIHHGNYDGYFAFKITDSSGPVVYDAAPIFANLQGLFDMGSDLPAGKTRTISGFPVSLRWPGRLDISTTCPGAELVAPNRRALSFPALHSLPVLLAVPGPAPSAADALDRALAETGGLFDACRPALDGGEVIGRIDPPDGHPGVPPLRARCSADIEPEPGFDVVTLLIVTPPDAPHVPIPEYFSIGFNLHAGSVWEVTRWRFVVTSDAVREVEPLRSVGISKGNGGGHPGFEYGFDQNGWHRESGDCVSGYEGSLHFPLPTPCG